MRTLSNEEHKQLLIQIQKDHKEALENFIQKSQYFLDTFYPLSDDQEEASLEKLIKKARQHKNTFNNQ